MLSELSLLYPLTLSASIHQSRFLGETTPFVQFYSADFAYAWFAARHELPSTIDKHLADA
jgi:hypothetical protein